MPGAPGDKRIPVYFVHGYNSVGAAHDLSAYMQALDPKKYRVEAFDYDYTQRLDKSAKELAQRIQAEGRPVHVLAHSMGGLVGLGAVKALDGTGAVRSVTTLATPFNGHKGAAFGVYLSPFNRREVLRDMIPGSDYQRSLSIPSTDTKHRVVIVDKDGRGDDDESISVDSQSKRKVLNNAADVSAYRDTHTGILRNTQSIQRWAGALRSSEDPAIVSGI